MKPLRPRHVGEWLALVSIIGWLKRCKLPLAAARACRLAHLGRLLLRQERAWVNTNLQLVYGPLDPTTLNRLATLAFENSFTSYLEGMRITDIQFREEGTNHLLEAYQQGRGAIACSVHLGGWEPLLKRVSDLGIPLAVVFREANNPLSEKIFAQARTAYGMGWIPRHQVRDTLRWLQEKKVLGLMVDINTRQGVVAPFLGMPARCPEGPAKLAARFQCPVVPIVGIREQPGRIVVMTAPPLDPPSRNASDETITAFTARLNQSFADWIHQYAEQYHWLHSRWRSRPDGSQWRPADPLPPMLAERCEPFPPLSDRVRTLLSNRFGPDGGPHA